MNLSLISKFLSFHFFSWFFYALCNVLLGFSLSLPTARHYSSRNIFTQFSKSWNASGCLSPHKTDFPHISYTFELYDSVCVCKCYFYAHSYLHIHIVQRQKAFAKQNNSHKKLHFLEMEQMKFPLRESFLCSFFADLLRIILS